MNLRLTYQTNLVSNYNRTTESFDSEHYVQECWTWQLWAWCVYLTWKLNQAIFKVKVKISGANTEMQLTQKFLFYYQQENMQFIVETSRQTLQFSCILAS